MAHKPDLQLLDPGIASEDLPVLLLLAEIREIADFEEGEELASQNCDRLDHICRPRGDLVRLFSEVDNSGQDSLKHLMISRQELDASLLDLLQHSLVDVAGVSLSLLDGLGEHQEWDHLELLGYVAVDIEGAHEGEDRLALSSRHSPMLLEEIKRQDTVHLCLPHSRNRQSGFPTVALVLTIAEGML